MNDIDAAPPSPPSVALLTALLGVAGAFHDRLEKALAEIDLSGAKLGVLSHLARADEPLPLRALAELQQCGPSNITTLVDRLETAGLVRRDPDPADRRSIRASLTPAGRDAATRGTRVWEDVSADFLAGLPAAESAALAQTLARLH